jgi:Tol biopolymer transport system component
MIEIRWLSALAVSLALFSLVPASRRQEVTPADLRAAHEAWYDGQHVTALREYIRILNSDAGATCLEQVALQTGELFRTEEITADGRAPRFSPDGKLIAYETGSGLSAITRIVETAGSHTLVAELQGTGAVFSASGRKVAYLKLRPSEELERAQAAVDAAPPGLARAAAQRTLTWLQAKHSSVRVRDLDTAREIELATENLLKSSLAISADGETVYFVGAREGDTSRNDVYQAAVASSPPAVVADVEGFKTSLVMDPTGRVLMFSIPTQNPFARPSAPPQSGERVERPATLAQPQDQEQRGQTAGQARVAFVPTKFGIVDLASRKATVINGSAPSFSPDGAAVAYVSRTAQESGLVLMPFGGNILTLLKGSDRLDTPAFSPDGKRLVYQRMTREDWEVFAINTDGKGETRITREIQHDVLPRFLSNDRILATVGEARHRRSYVYDLKTNTRVRLFHNNTVRTIAPEYGWAATPDGSKVLIWADRDGDTISEQRGVYLVDLNTKVTKAELLARLERNLEAEVSLRSEAQRVFAPIENDIRRVIQTASSGRIFEYEKALFDFDSRHISRPGNRQAADYLFGMYKSFGYEPEYQWFDVRTAAGGKTANVIATVRGTENPELVYVVSSHYDSVAAGPGADDDTSGTAALLEAARILAGKPLPATVVFASFTGEEAGLLGSREFVRRAQAAKTKIAGALNNDMIGWANDSRLDNTIRYTNAGIRDVQHAAALRFSRLITYDSRYHRSTDATAFYEAYGDIVGGIGGYPIIGNPRYHTAADLLETINHELVTETCKATVAALMHLASSPSPVKDLRVVKMNGKTAELAWSNSPEKGVQRYLVSYRAASGQERDLKVSLPRVVLHGITPGTVVRVKPVNSRGLEGWDWARVMVPESK